jgi:hypothetical protein
LRSWTSTSRRTYDTLADVSLTLRAGGDREPRDPGRLLDQAKEFYRQAHRAYRDGERRRAEGLAMAANDAGRGLWHVLRAGQPAVADLPLPPEDAGPPPPRGGPEDRGGAWAAVHELLQRTRDRLGESGADDPGRPFTDAAGRAYIRARQAYQDGDYARATELAHGAEAWTHVGEHLQRAGADVARDRDEPPPPPPDRPRGGRGSPPPLPPPLEE